MKGAMTNWSVATFFKVDARPTLLPNIASNLRMNKWTVFYKNSRAVVMYALSTVLTLTWCTKIWWVERSIVSQWRRIWATSIRPRYWFSSSLSMFGRWGRPPHKGPPSEQTGLPEGTCSAVACRSDSSWLTSFLGLSSTQALLAFLSALKALTLVLESGLTYNSVSGQCLLFVLKTHLETSNLT